MTDPEEHLSESTIRREIADAAALWQRLGEDLGRFGDRVTSTPHGWRVDETDGDWFDLHLTPEQWREVVVDHESISRHEDWPERTTGGGFDLAVLDLEETTQSLRGPDVHHVLLVDGRFQESTRPDRVEAGDAETVSPVSVSGGRWTVYGPLRGTRVVVVLVGLALAVSIVHYIDNVVNYADYPQPDPGAAVPAPSAGLIAVAWFVFTALGVGGLLLFLRRRLVPATVLLALYSGSGLIGIGHYTVPGATSMVWWRQLHVVADIVLGVALLVTAAWTFAINRHRARPPSPHPR